MDWNDVNETVAQNAHAFHARGRVLSTHAIKARLFAINVERLQ